VKSRPGGLPGRFATWFTPVDPRSIFGTISAPNCIADEIV
jgi:hypothetical protein